MQPATVAGDLMAAVLSPEQLQILARAARMLRREVEDILNDVNRYAEQLTNLPPAARAEAIEKAVQEWAARAAEASASGQRLPATRSRRNPLDRALEGLLKRQGSLASALRSGRYSQIQRTARLTEATIEEAVTAANQLAVEESWTETRLADRVKEIRAPAVHFLKEARGRRPPLPTGLPGRTTR